MATARKFAEGTTISVARSRDEIEKMLAKHGASGFIYGEQGNRAMIAFELHDRRYRMDLNYPGLSEFSAGRVNQYRERERTPAQKFAAYEAEKQRLWRGLALLVKAKLEAIASGISTEEEELLSYTVMSNGQTVGEWIEPQLEEMYERGTMPAFLPGIMADSSVRALPSRKE